MAVDQPSDSRPVRGLRLRDIATDLDARWHRGALGRVEPERHVIVTDDGSEVHYDHLVLALGARPEREWQAKGVLTYRDAGDAHEYRRLLRQLKDGRVSRVAFVKPDGASWPLPLYELALAAAAECDACGAEVELSLVTPEVEPLESFGAPARQPQPRVRLAASGVRLYSGSHGVPSRPGRLHVSPGERRLHVDRIVTLPRLVGPSCVGSPAIRPASSAPTPTAASSGYETCSPRAMRRRFRSSREASPRSRPTRSPRQSRRPVGADVESAAVPAGPARTVDGGRGRALHARAHRHRRGR